VLTVKKKRVGKIIAGAMVARDYVSHCHEIVANGIETAIVKIPGRLRSGP
jgi:hypothetical protein